MARVRQNNQELYCCDPQLVAAKPDCFLFNPKSVECSALYYQDQILLSHFFGFVRSVSLWRRGDVQTRRIVLQQVDEKRDAYMKYQESLQKATTCVDVGEAVKSSVTTRSSTSSTWSR